jgi:hypothetical protein
MSVLGQAIDAIREALKLTDEVRRAGETLKDLAQEIRDHDRPSRGWRHNGRPLLCCRGSGWNKALVDSCLTPNKPLIRRRLSLSSHTELTVDDARIGN